MRLVAHAHTPALRHATFAAGETGLDEGGRRAALALARNPAINRADACLSSPAEAAVETAQMVSGCTPTIVADLADGDYGQWTGRTLAEIAADDPDGLRSWLTDPRAAPHGGETIATLITRIGGWLDTYIDSGLRVLAVTHPIIVRAAMVHALQAPPSSLWRFDVAPAAHLHLSSDGRRLHVRLDGPT
ncbi:histidine phosphatase family protein [Micromonospora sp. 4G55]|nr:histidine phosphatase family protein [Micromonospora sp. 4G55]MBM0257706.1 histidine phosphatase family protein [Micromonospora sp. 4G55]